MTYATIATTKDYDAVADLLNRLLQAIVDIFADNDVSLPDRQYIHCGAVAQDCEQVTVQLMQVFLGSPGTPPGSPVRCDSARSAVIRINILRKAPALGTRGQIPTADDLSAAATQYARDMWLLFDVPARVNDLNGSVIADADPIEPAGGFSGSGLNLTVAIP